MVTHTFSELVEKGFYLASVGLLGKREVPYVVVRELEILSVIRVRIKTEELESVVLMGEVPKSLPAVTSCIIQAIQTEASLKVLAPECAQLVVIKHNPNIKSLILNTSSYGTHD
jgi:hypothetical protein